MQCRWIAQAYLTGPYPNTTASIFYSTSNALFSSVLRGKCNRMLWVDGACIGPLSLLEVQEAESETVRMDGGGCIAHPIAHPTTWTGGL